MPEEANKPTPDAAANNTGNASTGTPTDKPADAQPKFTQDDQNALAAKVRKEEKEKYERETTKAKQEADEAKAREQGEFKKLADDFKAELDDVKPKYETAVAELEAHRAAIAGIAKTELAALPEEVRDMSPSIDKPLDVLAWLPKGKKLAEALGTAKARPGAGGDPKPTAPNGLATVEQAKSELRASGRYAI